MGNRGTLIYARCLSRMIISIKNSTMLLLQTLTYKMINVSHFSSVFYIIL